MVVHGHGPYAFLKFGKHRHIDALLRRGALHLKTLDYFRRGDDGNIRYDHDEGLQMIAQGPSMRIDLSVRGQTLLSDAGGKVIRSLRVWQQNTDAINIYCLTALTALGRFPYHPGFARFGPACLLITEVAEFMARVSAAISDRVRNAHSAPVDYVHPAIHAGDMGVFRKFNTYEWQREYRIAVEPLVFTGDAMDIEAGPLTDIAQVLETHRLENAEFLPRPRK